MGESVADSPNALDNARLLAAAPDLYAALEEMLAAYEQLFPGIKHIAVADYALVNTAPIMAHMAMAKATEGE